MKKIIYSGWLKVFAVVLFVAGMVLGVLAMANGVVAFYNEEDLVYSFESDFEDSWHIRHLLNEPENLVYMVYHDLYYDGYDIYGSPKYKDTYTAPNSAAVADTLQTRLNNFYYNEEVNYFVQWNDMEFTNCGAKTPEELMQGEYYSYVKRDSQGNVARSSSNDLRAYLMEDLDLFDSVSTIIVSCSISEETVKEYKAQWELQEAIVFDAFVQTLICVIVALLALIYLTGVCGKDKNGAYKNMWLDNIWAEIHLAAFAGFGIGATFVCAFVLDEYVSGYFPFKFVYPILGTATALGSFMILTCLLSVIRNIKTRRLLETSIILRVIRWIARLFIKAAKWLWRKTKAFWSAIIKMLSKKTGIVLLGLLVGYTVLVVFFAIATVVSPLWLILGILFFGFACFVVAYRAKDMDAIKNGVSQVRNGNVSYKIPEPKSEDMKVLAANINDIAKGLDESVSAKVKAERLKTELITNVSHDLKTPITSIISYTELLSKMEELPEEARDYVSVIAKKSDRLKRLTQDLFDISKVQSGNENVVLEKLDVELLIQQALAEQDNEIQASGLPFCVDAPKELYIAADGRKMSRVLHNLIGNILKYTMKNTRVFITAREQDETIIIELKNISAYPINFSAEEITQRFVRGDDARSTEGNGLGLAIAKSYTEACGGSFEIVTDGDLFKAILQFGKYD